MASDTTALIEPDNLLAKARGSLPGRRCDHGPKVQKFS